MTEAKLSLSEMFKGTFLEDIIDPDLDLGLVSLAEHPPIAEGEEIIGEFSDLEYRLKAASIKMALFAQTSIKKSMALEEEGKKEEAIRASRLAEAFYRRGKILMELTWAILTERIDGAVYVDVLGIRGRDHKVVSVKSSSESPLQAAMKELIKQLEEATK